MTKDLWLGPEYALALAEYIGMEPKTNISPPPPPSHEEMLDSISKMTWREVMEFKKKFEEMLNNRREYRKQFGYYRDEL